MVRTVNMEATELRQTPIWIEPALALVSGLIGALGLGVTAALSGELAVSKDLGPELTNSATGCVVLVMATASTPACVAVIGWLCARALGAPRAHAGPSSTNLGFLLASFGASIFLAAMLVIANVSTVDPSGVRGPAQLVAPLIVLIAIVLSVGTATSSRLPRR